MSTKRDWSFMKEHMPGVVAMLQRERSAGKGTLIDEFWRRGVVAQEPGWFYAHQNGVTVGVPSVEFLRDPNQASLQAMFPTAAVLMLNGSMVCRDVPYTDEPRQLNRREQQAQALLVGNLSSEWNEEKKRKDAGHGAD